MESQGPFQKKVPNTEGALTLSPILKSIGNIACFFARRAKSLDGEYEDEDDDDFFFENEFSNVNYWRHEYCYDEFQGYGAEYSGPIGILTSFLPDGTSVLKNKPEKSRDGKLLHIDSSTFKKCSPN